MGEFFCLQDCNRNARKYSEGLENQNKASMLDNSFSNDETFNNVQTKLDSISDKFLQVGDNFRQLDAQLERVAASEVQYQRAKSELERSLPELKRRVDECSGVPGGSNEKNLQEAVERIKEVTGGVMEAGKQMKELRESGDSLVQVLDVMSLRDCAKAREIRGDLDRVQDTYNRIQEITAEKQRELNKAVVQTQDANQNLTSLLQWVEESEAYMDRLTPVSLDRARLATQLQEHRSFSSELETRRPRVGAVVDQCQAQGGGDKGKVDELLDRFDALRSKNEVRGTELEDVVRRLTELHSSVDQMETWLTGAVHSLKRSGSSLDQNSLKAKIEGLYVQKHGKQPDLEKIKTIGRELIDDPITGDKHHLREMIADMQGKWQDLTELLVQMISYSVSSNYRPSFNFF